jgi:hypothetical protein
MSYQSAVGQVRIRLTELGGTNLRCQGSYERFNACTNLAALAGFHSS